MSSVVVRLTGSKAQAEVNKSVCVCAFVDISVSTCSVHFSLCCLLRAPAITDQTVCEEECEVCNSGHDAEGLVSILIKALSKAVKKQVLMSSFLVSCLSRALIIFCLTYMQLCPMKRATLLLLVSDVMFERAVNDHKSKGDDVVAALLFVVSA